MPKWTDYTIKTNPADKDEVMILDTAGKANKRLGLSALSDWIIGKIANKVFENLQTQNKTILGALNELNSKFLTGEIHGVDIEDYLSKLGQNSCGLLYFSYNNKNAPVIDGFGWKYFSLIVIHSRIIAFSPSGAPNAIITRQFIDTAWTNWAPIKSNFNTSWQNGNGKSIFDIFTPSGTCGIYSYYNIADIPNLEAANAFVGIFKWNEGMLVVADPNIYITVSSLNVWEKKWRKISSTLVS